MRSKSQMPPDQLFRNIFSGNFGHCVAEVFTNLFEFGRAGHLSKICSVQTTGSTRSSCLHCGVVCFGLVYGFKNNWVIFLWWSLNHFGCHYLSSWWMQLFLILSAHFHLAVGDLWNPPVEWDSLLLSTFPQEPVRRKLYWYLTDVF